MERRPFVMRKLLVIFTAVVFIASFVIPVVAATTPGPSTGMKKMAKPSAAKSATMSKSSKTMHSSAKMTAAKKMKKACVTKRKHHHKKMSSAAKRGKGPATYAKAKYVRKGGTLWKCTKKMGAGSMKYHKKYRRSSSGAKCPPMPGKTY